MEHLHTAVTCACCAALGLTLAESVVPTERFEKQIRLLLAILMMTVILTPLTRLDLSVVTANAAYAEKTAADLTEIAQAAQQSAVTERIIAALNGALSSNGVNCEVIAADVHILPDGGICINEVTVHGNLLTGSVYLREWLGADTAITEGGDAACMN